MAAVQRVRMATCTRKAKDSYEWAMNGQPWTWFPVEGRATLCRHGRAVARANAAGVFCLYDAVLWSEAYEAGIVEGLDSPRR